MRAAGVAQASASRPPIPAPHPGPEFRGLFCCPSAHLRARTTETGSLTMSRRAREELSLLQRRHEPDLSPNPTWNIRMLVRLREIASMQAALILTRELSRLGRESELRKRVAIGDLLRLRAGVYVQTAEWEALDIDARYRTRVRAAAAVSPSGTQFSHDSAAALWRLPRTGAWSRDIHVVTEPTPGGTSRCGIRHHGHGLDPRPSMIDGVAVTSLARTLVDVAASADFVHAIVKLDAGLRRAGGTEHGNLSYETGPDKTDLFCLLESRTPFRGAVRARRAIEFADGHSGSALESYFRVQCHALGLPAPTLQAPFYDEQGLIGYTDFFWPHLGLIIEIDGASKYGSARRFQRGIDPAEIVRLEKLREDRLRRVSNDFARPPWPVVKDLRALATFLNRHGLWGR